jgi:hypothetical protein
MTFPYSPLGSDLNAGGEDLPPPGFFSKWFVGVIVPLVLVALGVICIVTRHAWLPDVRGWRYGHDYSIPLHDSRATAMGLICLGIAGFLHCHFYWGNIYYEYPCATIGKIVSLMAFVGGLVFIIINVGLLGRV